MKYGNDKNIESVYIENYSIELTINDLLKIIDFMKKIDLSWFQTFSSYCCQHYMY